MMNMAQSSTLAFRIYQNLWASLDLVFPPSCGGCGRPGACWCHDCQSDVRTVELPLCERCGQSLNLPGECENCRTSPPYFTAVRSWAVFEGPVRQAIHRLKYKREISLGVILAQPLIAYLRELDWVIEGIIPVPLGVARLRERGYNQSILLARPLALGSGKPYCPQGLIRARETRSQVGLSFTQRRDNVTGAFQARSKWVTDRCVLVVDDVSTSNATLDACAKALLNGGARKVYGLTLARAGRQHVQNGQA